MPQIVCILTLAAAVLDAVKYSLWMPELTACFRFWRVALLDSY
jgi:hypothetical protein